MRKRKYKTTFAKHYGKAPFTGFEVFWLHYYGVNVFLAVGENNYLVKDVFYVYELQTRIDYEKDCEKLELKKNQDFFTTKPSGKCLLLPEGSRNGHTLQSIPVSIERMRGYGYVIPFQITMNSKIYREAVRLGVCAQKEILVGKFYATMIGMGLEDIDKLQKESFQYRVRSIGKAGAA